MPNKNKTSNKKKQGKRRRFSKIEQKALKDRGFGDRIPDSASTTKWYCIEYNRETETETELVELHWLKVTLPPPENMKLIKTIMVRSGAVEVVASPLDFLAGCHFNESMRFESRPQSLKDTLLKDKGVNCAFLYRAGAKGDRTLRTPILVLIPDRATPDRSTQRQQKAFAAFVYKYCEVSERVPGHCVTLQSARSRRLSTAEIETAAKSIRRGFLPLLEGCGFIWRIRKTDLYKKNDGFRATFRLYNKAPVSITSETETEAIVVSLSRLLDDLQKYRDQTAISLLLVEFHRLVGAIEPRLLKVDDRSSPLPTSELNRSVLELSEKIDILF